MQYPYRHVAEITLPGAAASVSIEQKNNISKTPSVKV
jgi:hypothetical protein